eukprot:15338046-Ditylum_brightwellii.AAC.1
MIKSLSDTTTTITSKRTHTQSWTINKIWFDAVGLLGRDKELNTLHACWNRMMQPEHQTKEVVMISAFVTGKFDQYNSGEPFSAISQAFGELCRMAVKNGAALCKEIEDALRAELKSE